MDDEATQRRLWLVRESGLGATAIRADGVHNLEGWEDAAVPPARLGEYLRGSPPCGRSSATPVRGTATSARAASTPATAQQVRARAIQGLDIQVGLARHPVALCEQPHPMTGAPLH